MPSRLTALRYQNVGPDFFGLPRFFDRTDLVSDDNARVFKATNDARLNIPEQRNDRDGQRDAGGDFRVEHVWRGRRRDQIDTKATAADYFAYAVSFVFDERRRFAYHAQKAEATGSGHRRHELRSGDTAHPGEHNRILATKDVTYGRAQRVVVPPVSSGGARAWTVAFRREMAVSCEGSLGLGPKRSRISAVRCWKGLISFLGDSGSSATATAWSFRVSGETL